MGIQRNKMDAKIFLTLLLAAAAAEGRGPLNLQEEFYDPSISFGNPGFGSPTSNLGSGSLNPMLKVRYTPIGETLHMEAKLAMGNDLRIMYLNNKQDDACNIECPYRNSEWLLERENEREILTAVEGCLAGMAEQKPCECINEIVGEARPACARGCVVCKAELQPNY